MNREKFLKQLGITAWLACTGSVLLNCSQDDPAPGTSDVDFVLDLTASQNAALNTVGGSLSSNGIIIARLSSTEFVALSRACTHQGTAVNYRASQNDFLCPNHGSRFATTGSVLQGPARTALRKYNTELTGNNLRIFS
jgi:cytochrome b6-f complex iron-sulfur subunit